MKTRRPRVAAIGLDDAQLASIHLLCGDLRPATTLRDYLQDYSWPETDVLVMGPYQGDELDRRASLMAIGPNSLAWLNVTDDGRRLPNHTVNTNIKNTDRELRVHSACPELYRLLAAELSRRIGQEDQPPDVIASTRGRGTALIETSSGRLVASRLALPHVSSAIDGEARKPIALLLPEITNLAA